MDRGAWQAIVYRVAKSWIRLKQLSMAQTQSTVSPYSLDGAPSQSPGHCQWKFKPKLLWIWGEHINDLSMDHTSCVEATRISDSCLCSCTEIGEHSSCNHKERICLTVRSRHKLLSKPIISKSVNNKSWSLFYKLYCWSLMLKNHIISRVF